MHFKKALLNSALVALSSLLFSHNVEAQPAIEASARAVEPTSVSSEYEAGTGCFEDDEQVNDTSGRKTDDVVQHVPTLKGNEHAKVSSDPRDDPAQKDDNRSVACPTSSREGSSLTGDDSNIASNDLHKGLVSGPPLKASDGIELTNRSYEGLEIALKGYIQFDAHGYGAKAEGENLLIVRRARLGVEGSLFKRMEFKVQVDFSDLNRISLRDVYVAYRVRDELKLWIGHMKEPWGQEELHGDSALDFVERSMVNNLVPPRNVGVMASGAFKNGVLEYQVGLFSGNKTLSREPNGPPEAVVRLRSSPWIKSEASLLKGLSFGSAYAYSQPESGDSVRGRTASRGITFLKTSKVSGPATRTNAEVSWLGGPASVRAEYGQTNQARRGLGRDGTNLSGVVARALMAQITFLLTGETKPDSKNVRPKRNFFEKEAGGRGLGAWELKLRYDNLALDESKLTSNRADSIYFGVNWYLNRRIRYLLDLGLERFQNPLRMSQADKRTSFVTLSRVQFTL